MKSFYPKPSLRQAPDAETLILSRQISSEQIAYRTGMNSCSSA